MLLQLSQKLILHSPHQLKPIKPKVACIDWCFELMGVEVLGEMSNTLVTGELH